MPGYFDQQKILLIQKDLLFSSLFFIIFSTSAKQKTLLNKDQQDQQHKVLKLSASAFHNLSIFYHITNRQLSVKRAQRVIMEEAAC